METKTKTKMRTGIFPDKNSVESAYKNALNHGYKPEDINIIMSNETRKKYYGDITTGTPTITDKSLEGLAIGGAVGGTVVGVTGAIIALSTTIVIPGLGLVIAGPLAAGLVGVGAGSIAGGIIGALIGAGIPEEHAARYEKGIKKGGIVMSVPSYSEHRDKILINNWKQNKGKDIS